MNQDQIEDQQDLTNARENSQANPDQFLNHFLVEKNYLIKYKSIKKYFQKRILIDKRRIINI